MSKRETGRYEVSWVGGEQVRTFVRFLLPPIGLDIEAALAARAGSAEQALVPLELAGEMVRSLDGFIYVFVRKDAVPSSQIVIACQPHTSDARAMRRRQ